MCRHLSRVARCIFLLASEIAANVLDLPTWQLSTEAKTGPTWIMVKKSSIKWKLKLFLFFSNCIVGIVCLFQCSSGALLIESWQPIYFPLIDLWLIWRLWKDAWIMSWHLHSADIYPVTCWDNRRWPRGDCWRSVHSETSCPEPIFIQSVTSQHF